MQNGTMVVITRDRSGAKVRAEVPREHVRQTPIAYPVNQGFRLPRHITEESVGGKMNRIQCSVLGLAAGILLVGCTMLQLWGGGVTESVARPADGATAAQVDAPPDRQPREKRSTPTWTASPAGVLPSSTPPESDPTYGTSAIAPHGDPSLLRPPAVSLNSPLPTPPNSPLPTPEAPSPTPMERTPSLTPTWGPTATSTRTGTPTTTPTPTRTGTVTRTPTVTRTRTITPTPTVTPTWTSTPENPPEPTPTSPSSPLPTPTSPGSPLPTPTSPGSPLPTPVPDICPDC